MSLLSRLAVQAARAYGMLVGGASTNVSADYLVVAGGASGGVIGGGGAGGYRTSTTTLSTLNTYSITVGAGGAGTTSQQGNNGSDSSLSGTGLTTITSTGGGGGAGENSTSVNNGKNGGSGGGAATAWNGSTSVPGTPGNGNTPSTSPSQGNNGGSTVATIATASIGGGGGGAGAVGANAIANSTSGNGGAGSSSSISGSSVTYAGGGGGGAYIFGGTGTAGTGGSGGGGNGGRNGLTSTAGTPNTGGGGGGRGLDSSGNAVGSSSGAGGSGIVIISYTSATPKFVGGTITTSGGKQIHTFTSSGTLSPITPITASYLVVAGGGGAVGNRSGGGGAGGLLTSSTTLYSGATYIVTIGAGGAGGAGTAGVSSTQDGSNSVLSGTGLTTITATGGGGGGGTNNPSSGRSGGSGGGAGGDNPTGATGGTGTSGQGFAGGTSATGGGAGGGGASAVGSNGSSNTGGNGGAGTASSISGTSVTYAGGGGGGATTTAGTGGAGGGGNGAGGSPTTQSRGVDGTQNSGGGAGGGSNYTTTAVTQASGGSGIVIISYAGSQQFNGGLVTTSGGNTIHTFTSTGALTPLTNNLNNSLRFRSSASAYLSRTPTLAGSTTIGTLSNWLKLGAISTDRMMYHVIGTSGNNNRFYISFNADNTFQIVGYNSSASIVLNLNTTQVLRDPSAWYHIVVAIDTTQATSSNRAKLYINGNQVTAFSTATYPSQNQALGFTNNTSTFIGANQGPSNYFDGYMTDINFIDGQALEPYYFGNNDANGVWKPIQYKGTYGTNGFYLTFGNTTSTTTLGYDSSPNGNNWTCNNISLTAGVTYDAMIDVPTNTSATVANYCTLNPLDKGTSGTLDRANLQWSSGASWQSARGTMTIPSGKFYFEGIITSTTSGSIGVNFGLATAANPLNVGGNSNTASYSVDATSSSNVLTAGSLSGSGSVFTAGDVLQYAIDRDNNRAWFGRNNTWYNSTLAATGDPVAGTNPTWSSLPADLFPFINTFSQTVNFNFGQRPFAYTPPSGYVALNTYNLPTPTILQGNKYMDATLYTGNGASTQVIVNQGQFRPDLVWGQARSAAYGSWIFDVVRGVTKQIESFGTNAESTQTTMLTAFNSNGFNMGSDTAGNQSGVTYVAWQWQAGSSTVTNTSGSISAQVRASTTTGFSIVTYTGTGANATVGHGLGVAPKMILVKNRTTAGGNGIWRVYHTTLGGTKYINLNETTAATTGSTVWNNTDPTSSVFSIGTTGTVNDSANNYVAYCFAAISGFSAFGSYTGNGSTDGPFVYLGFRPKWVLIKRTDSSTSGNWSLLDSSINTYNEAQKILTPNTADSESTQNYLDLLSNGFKVRYAAANQQINTNGGSYIYAAFAENPFKNSNAR